MFLSSKKQEVKRTIFLLPEPWCFGFLKGLVRKRINPNCLDFLSRQTQHQSQWLVFVSLHVYFLLIWNIENIKNIENVIKFSNPPIFYKNVNIHIIGKIICVIFHTWKCLRILLWKAISNRKFLRFLLKDYCISVFPLSNLSSLFSNKSNN